MSQFLDLDLCVCVALTLGHFLWQGTLAAIVLAAFGALLRRVTSQTRYLVNLGMLLLMAVSPLVTFAIVSRHRADGGQGSGLQISAFDIEPARDSNQRDAWRQRGLLVPIKS